MSSVSVSPQVLPDGSRDALLARVGLADGPLPGTDLAGLRAVTRAFIAHVPYENLAVQLGESQPLEVQQLVARVLRGGRGGYCFEANTVLMALLQSLGFTVERRLGIVGEPSARMAGAPVNHMALVVTLAGGERWLADAGLGEGPVEPVRLLPGTVRVGEFTWHVERRPDGWWVGAHELCSIAGFWFGDRPAALAEFQPHHRRLSTSPESSFVQTLVVQRPAADHLRTLRARTLSRVTPEGRERRRLESAAELAEALESWFGIEVAALGAERITRLWARCVAQDERWREAQT